MKNTGPLESTIVKNIIAKTKARAVRNSKDIFVIKLHGGPYQRIGLPDIMIVCSGHIAFLEVKRPGCSPTAIQRHCMHQLRTAGATAVVVHSWDEAKTVLGVD